MAHEEKNGLIGGQETRYVAHEEKNGLTGGKVSGTRREKWAYRTRYVAHGKEKKGGQETRYITC